MVLDVKRGQIVPNTPIKVVDRDGNTRSARILQVLEHKGLERIESQHASAGDIIAITGAGELNISDTLCDSNHPEALPPLSVDEPTISMVFESTALHLQD